MVAILNFSNTFKKSPAHPLAAVLNFGSILKKSLAHPHAARNVMLKLQKNDQIIFFYFSAPSKKTLICGGQFEF